MKMKLYVKLITLKLRTLVPAALKSMRLTILKSFRLFMEKSGACCKRIASHREAIGYYSMLTLVLVALAAAAHNYRTEKNTRVPLQVQTAPDPGISVQTNTDPTIAPEPQTFILPVQGEIIGSFAEDELIWSTTMQLWQTHPAIDIAAAAGEAVIAAADGTIIDAYSDALYGNIIIIEHDDGSLLKYASLNTLQLTQIGQRIHQGDVISSVGTCSVEAELGAHLHLEYFLEGKPADFSLLI